MRYSIGRGSHGRRRWLGATLLTLLPVAACDTDRMPEARRAVAAAVGGLPLFPPTSQEEAQSREKLALIVAIADQGEQDEAATAMGARAYNHLNGPVNDVGVVSAALQHHGFLTENIATLRDADATREGILGALEDLVERAGEGDVAVFVYAGHGHQITDDNGDEIDGYDEILVPYGAPDYSVAEPDVQAAYGGEGHIRDDELGIVLDRLAAKVGPEGSLAVFLDACFSGTGTRGAGQMVARGGERPIGPTQGVRGRMDDVPGTGFAEPPRTRGPGAGDAGELDYVVISAASHRQLAYETYHTDGQTIVGTLSHALSVALPRLRPGDSYRDLHSHIAEVIRSKQPGQSAQIEGAADIEVFGNLLTDHEAWVRVASDDGDGRLVLEGGQLRGLGTGSEVEVRGSAGSDDAEVALATGTVAESSPLSSVVELDSLPADGRDLTAARAFVTRESFGDLTAKILVDESVDREIADLIRDSLNARWIMSVTTDPDGGADGIITQEGPARTASAVARVRLTATHNGMPVGEVFEVSVDGRSISDLANHVESFARSAYLRRLNPHDPSLDVTLSLHPWDGDPTECRPTMDATGFVDQITLAAGHAFFLKVTNHTGAAPYFTILNLMPNAAVSQLFPAGRLTYEEAQLTPNQELTIPTCFAAGLMRDSSGDVIAVPGTEVLKLFATREPVDFRPLLATRGRSHRGGGSAPNDLERLFVETHVRTRSVEVGARPAMATVSSVQIEVVLDQSGGR